ncbi:MAG: two-component sensor histidine kinase [Deltaproteobacteria bacterium RBG_16_47_11]|nr:MAG: two-component sensor histidine kinase [Deltaproteobacteria bacterium RBG_16_47_11]
MLSFLGISFLVCGVALLVGGQLLYKAVLNEANTRISLDLNAAREIYLSRIKGIKVALNITTLGPVFRSALERRDAQKIIPLLTNIAQQTELDFVGIVTKEGKTLCRIGPNSIPKENSPSNPIANLALQQRIAVSGTVILNNEILFSENPELANRARIKLLATKKATPRPEIEEFSGLALAAAVPIFESGNFLGVLYGGVLLNRSQDIVDRVRDTVFQHEIYKGQSIGTATIFFKDIRVSTNVLSPDGSRAIGTVASEEVTKHVLTEGKKWTDRAFVVNDWYITAYEPIEDIFGQRVGMLYVGVLEAKYADVRWKALSLFILITVAGMVLALGLGYIIANKMSRPVQQLIEASNQVSKGNLSPEIGPISKSEIGVLQKTFKEMLTSIQERDKRQRVESEIKLLQSEKQASVGKLAGGVAHEINNPLTGIVTFTHMLLRRNDIPEEVRTDLETVAQETERVRKIVKGLLDFSRQTELDREPTDVNRLVRQAITLVENQALIKGVNLTFEPGDGLSMVTLDRNQMQSVLLNIIINALDATDPGGSITITTNIGISTSKPGQKGIEILCTDTGCGIPPENLNRLFDPFFTTKEVGHGTGLGLSVSYGIVERHGGTIWVQSKVGKGSTFKVWLPTEEQSEGNENISSG